MPMTRIRQLAGFVVSLLLCYGVAAVGAVASISARDFYQQLERPVWSPPGSVFGPVWSLLYTLMAVAAWLVWRAGGLYGARRALGLFLLQLAWNALWSWLFFAWRLGGLAMADIVLLWATLLATIVAFHRWSRPAAWLLAPYLAWVSFAAALNFAVWQANPGLLQ